MSETSAAGYTRVQPSYRPDIDGLRAVAVTAVVVYHAFPTGLRAGFLGVDVFFVISGFLITRLILSETVDDRFGIVRFYSRRIRRIFPALITVLAASFLLGWWLLLPAEFAALGEDIVDGALFISNFQLWIETGYFDRAADLKPLLHLWSLGVEEQFYLVWPILLVLAARTGVASWKLAAGIATASYIGAILLDRHHPIAAFYLPAPRFWELMIGAVLADAAGPARFQPQAKWHTPCAVLGLGLILSSFAGFVGHSPEHAWFRGLSTVGAGLLIFAGPDNWLSRALLSNRATVWLGKISYPLYLWHWPLLYFFRITHPDKISTAARIAVVAMSLGLAWTTYVLIERPIRFGRLRRIAVPASTLLLIGWGGIGWFDYQSQGFPSRYPEPIRGYLIGQYDFAQNARVHDCWLMSQDLAFSPTCTPAAESGKPSLWIWGDSHAARLYPGLVEEYGNKLRIGQLTKSSCLPILLEGSEECKKNNDLVLALIEKSPPDMIVMFAAWNKYNLILTNKTTAGHIAATVARLKTAGVKRVLLLGPAPQWTEDLPKVLAEIWRDDIPFHRIPAVTDFRLASEIFDVDRELEQIAAAEGIEYFSIVKRLCDGRGCLARLSDGLEGLMTWDYGHLTSAGAAYVARLLRIGTLD